MAISPEDLGRINRAGGRDDPARTIRPIFMLALSARFAHTNGRFSVEERPASGFRLRRAVWKGFPVLLISAEPPRAPVFHILLALAGTWVLEIQFFRPGGRPADIQLWTQFLGVMEHGAPEVPVGTLAQRKIEPDFGDGPAFRTDIAIWNQNPAQLAYDSTQLPILGRTTEQQLYGAFPEASISRRYSFPRSVQMNVSGSRVRFDRWLEYSSVRREMKRRPGVLEVRTQEFLVLEFFLLRGIVQHFLVDHKIRQGRDFVQGPLARSPDDQKYRAQEIIQRYARIRSPAFRRYFRFKPNVEELLPRKETVTEIDLSGMQLRKIPTAISAFRKLETLNATRNGLRTITCAGLPTPQPAGRAPGES